MRPSFVGAALGVGLLLSSPPPAHAAEVQLATGPSASASTWRGDGALSGALKIGMRYADVIAIDTLSRLGYANVDQRMLTYLSLGLSVYGRVAKDFRPFGRLALVHQHEEPVSNVRHDAFGALMGVGDGIRHRAGPSASIGVDWTVRREGNTEVVLGVDANTTWFPDPRGPELYVGGGLWLGVNHAL